MTPSLANRSSEAAAFAFGEGEKAAELEVAFLSGDQRVQSRSRAYSHRNDPAAGREQLVQERLRSGWDLAAAREDGLRCSLGYKGPPGRTVGQRRAELPLVVEGQLRDPLPLCDAGGRPLRRGPECAVEIVAADDSLALQCGLVGNEPQCEHMRAGRSCRVGRRLEADMALGEGARLVGEQHRDVTEVLNRY